MRNRQYYEENRWRLLKGLPESNQNLFLFDRLKETQWSVDFEQLMRSRLIMGALRYGEIKAKNKPQYDRVDSMIKRLKKYQDSGNKEFLVDVANLSLLEFVECHHPNAHFSSIDDGDHVNKI